MRHFCPKPILGFTIAVCVLAGTRVIVDGSGWGHEAASRKGASTLGVPSHSTLLSSGIEDVDDGVAGQLAGLPSADVARGAPSSFDARRAARVDAFDGHAGRPGLAADPAILEPFKPGPDAGDGKTTIAPVLRGD